jgi:hypothetical protein
VKISPWIQKWKPRSVGIPLPEDLLRRSKSWYPIFQADGRIDQMISSVSTGGARIKKHQSRCERLQVEATGVAGKKTALFGQGTINK